MARVQLPPAQDRSGRYVSGKKVIGVYDLAGDPVTGFTTAEGLTEVTYPVESTAEGAFAAFYPMGTYNVHTDPAQDGINNVTRVELVSAEDIATGDLSGSADEEITGDWTFTNATLSADLVRTNTAGTIIADHTFTPTDGVGSVTAKNLAVLRSSPGRLRYEAEPAKSSGSSAITATDNTLTVSASGSALTASDVGKSVMVEGAGASGDNLVTTIASVTDATHAELTQAAATTVTLAQAYWGDDASVALQALLDAGGPIEIVDTYLVENTITLPDNANINGANRTRGARGRLVFIGGATDNCLESADVNQSGLYIGNLDIRDRREGATDGDGINLNAPKNSVNIERVWCWDWANNGITLSATAGFAPDVITLRNVWSTGFGQYGVHIQRAANNILISHLSGDTRGVTQAGGALLAFDTMATNGQATIVVQALKFECGNIAAHGILADAAGATMVINGAVMLSQNANAGGSVVHRVSGTVIANGLATLDAAATAPGADCLFNDVAGGVKYGDGLRRMGQIVCPGTSGTVARSQYVGDLAISGELEVDGALNHDGTTAGFYGTTPIAKPTGVAVTAAGVHAALVSLGLIGS